MSCRFFIMNFPKGRNKNKKEITKMSEKKLYKSESDKKIAGVCGGLAAYLGIDSTIVRLIWAGLVLFAGVGLLAYILAAIIIPSEPEIG